ncbi:LOW QUALITY PROTEIN: Sexual differentiation process protein isp4 [Paramyrothecium foliicola]|nr:LOW QUALITY PROTEIN: Sexual differentiation process protein isp4 [Paramyrothecium foliicola]
MKRGRWPLIAVLAVDFFTTCQLNERDRLIDRRIVFSYYQETSKDEDYCMPTAAEMSSGDSDAPKHDQATITESAEQVEPHLDVTDDDLLEAEELAATYSLSYVREKMLLVYRQHERDPNFPMGVIRRIGQFLENDSVFEQPEKHEQLITEMKIQLALITGNSPYAQVRSVVSNRDDPSMPASTIRAWAIGFFFCVAISFINVFFDPRVPGIHVSSSVPQLLAYPLGKMCEKVLPDAGFTLFGVRHSLNPGPFNKKEHMLITIMASTSIPYTNYIIWIQILPQFLHQPYAMSFAYQILITLSTSFIGYGMAGLGRRFLVYPSYCLWPGSLVTIALNNAFHDDRETAVLGPFRRIWTLSRLKFFAIAASLMFVYFWLPNTIFMGLGYFSWMTWIAPNNTNLTTVTGSLKGMGINPFPTWDWNMFVYWLDPLVVPWFTTWNFFVGASGGAIVVLAMYYGNAFHSGYIPITSNSPWDRFALPYNVSSILDERGIIDYEKYQAYSPAYISAGNTALIMSFFAMYTGAITYALLHYRREIALGCRDLINGLRPSRKHLVENGRVLDIHDRLMKAYPEVSEWWYMICLVAASIMGCAAIANWPTYTTVGVVFYGIALCLIFIIPVGIIMAVTGIEVSLNILAEFIGGAWVEGNALALSFFKAYGYVTCSHALSFTNFLKMAHYVKIPPRFTFWAQMLPTLVSSFVSVGVVQYQARIENICTADAPFRFHCPGVRSFFTAAVMWGTIGPKRLWGVGGQYAETLVGFPAGVVIVVFMWYLGKRFPRSGFVRSIHPIIMISGGIIYSPFNMSYLWPAVPVSAMSWLFVKSRMLAFWSKYNFVLSAAFSCGIAISALVQFFSLTYNDITIDWWGNSVIAQGCEASGACLHRILNEGESFGPGPGEFK